MNNVAEHAFVRSPKRTLLALSFPVLLSLIAEPLTGLVDTAFVASLGATALAALGVGTVALSSTFWIFNFLGIGAQTGVAQYLGQGNQKEARRLSSLAMLLGIGVGVVLILVLLPLIGSIAGLMGTDAAVRQEAESYMRIRLFGAPAVLIFMVAFGSLRGLQDMRTPLWIAAGANVLNVLLDWVLIFGHGPFPALGVAGSALASSISQWVGAVIALVAVARQLGYTTNINLSDVRALLKIGGDLFVRTGLLFVFLLVSTRVANQAGANSGAAHQAIRQIFVFTALVLEAFASTAQSLVGYFVGARKRQVALQVVVLTTRWSLLAGVLLAALMLAGRPLVMRFLVPPSAIAVFGSAWLISAISMPINALAFITDGVHWGTGDYGYLRNAMGFATLCGGLALFLVDPHHPDALTHVWVAVTVWILVRASLGLVRVWPGVGDSPLRVSAEPSVLA